MRRGLMPLGGAAGCGGGSGGGSGGAPSSSGIGATKLPTGGNSRKQPSPILNLSPGLEHSTSPVTATAIAVPGGSAMDSRRASPSYVEFREFLQQNAGPSGMSSAASEAAREAAALELIDLCSRSSVAQKLEDADAVDELLLDANGHHRRRLIPIPGVPSGAHLLPHHPPHVMPYGALLEHAQLAPDAPPQLPRNGASRKRPASRASLTAMAAASVASRRRRTQQPPQQRLVPPPMHAAAVHHHEHPVTGGSSGVSATSSTSFPVMCCVAGSPGGVHPCQLNPQSHQVPHQHPVQHPHLHHHAMIGSWIAAPLYPSSMDYVPFVANQNVNPVPLQRRSSRELTAAAAAVAQHAMLMQRQQQQSQQQSNHHVVSSVRDPAISLGQTTRLPPSSSVLQSAQTPPHPSYVAVPASTAASPPSGGGGSQLMTAPPPMTYNPQELLGMMMAMNDTSFRLWENTDALMQVAERMSQASKMPRGLNRSEIEALPCFRFSHSEPDEQSVCVVCQTDFELKENIRALPCSHIFHSKCIDKWLKTNRTCPICRSDSAPAEPQAMD